MDGHHCVRLVPVFFTLLLFFNLFMDCYGSQNISSEDVEIAYPTKADEFTTEWITTVSPRPTRPTWSPEQWAAAYRRTELLIRWRIALKWCSFVLAPLGVIFNFLSFITFAGMSRKQNIAFVLMCLTFIDMMVLSETIVAVVGWAGIRPSPKLCLILPMFTFPCRNISNMFLTLVAFERLISVRYPLKVNLWCTRKRIKIAVVGFLVLGFAMESWRPSLIKIKNNICYSDNVMLINLISFIIHRIMGFFFPWLFIVTCNITTIWTLRKWSKKRAEITGQGKDSASAGVDKSLTVMFICMSLYSFVCLAPMAYVDFRKFYALKMKIVPFKDWYFTSVAAQLMLLNYAGNFILYCLTGKTFRQQLFRILRGAFYCIIRRQIPSKTTSVQKETGISNISSQSAAV